MTGCVARWLLFVIQVVDSSSYREVSVNIQGGSGLEMRLRTRIILLRGNLRAHLVSFATQTSIPSSIRRFTGP